MDLLGLIPKTVRPLDAQEDYESRKFWQEVTGKMLSKAWGEATASKQAIEQHQRDKAAERKEKGEVFEPRFFQTKVRPKPSPFLRACHKLTDSPICYLLAAVRGRSSTPDGRRTESVGGRARRRRLLDGY